MKNVVEILAKGITFFCEYNFNAYLPINAVRIQEILLFSGMMIKLNFRNLDDNEYLDCINILKNGNFLEELENKFGERVINRNLMESEKIYIDKKDMSLNYSGDKFLLKETGNYYFKFFRNFVKPQMSPDEALVNTLARN